MAIQLRRNTTSGTIPHPAELVSGEVAINTADLELYAEDTAGNVLPLNRPAYPSVKPKSGEYQCGMIVNNTVSTLALTANRAYWYPFVAGHTVTLDRASIWVTSAVASSLARVGLYASDPDGWPIGTALYESGDLNCATTGEKFDTCTLTLRRGEQYWAVVHSSSTQVVRAALRTEMIQVYAHPNTAYPSSMIYNTQTFALGLPGVGSFTYSNLNVPLVYWRTA